MPLMYGHRYDPPVDLASLKPSVTQCVLCKLIRTVDDSGQVDYSYPPELDRDELDKLTARHACQG